MTIEDDPFMLTHGAGSGVGSDSANLSDWSDIVQDALRKASQSSDKISPEIITQLEIALSAINPESKQSTNSSDDKTSPSASIFKLPRRED